MIPNAWSGFDFGLGPDVDMLRKSVSGFAQDRIAPRAAAIDRDNEFPRDLWPEMGALGLHGITVEEKYGGSGLGYLEHCVAMEEISRASAAVAIARYHTTPRIDSSPPSVTMNDGTPTYAMMNPWSAPKPIPKTTPMPSAMIQRPGKSTWIPSTRPRKSVMRIA